MPGKPRGEWVSGYITHPLCPLLKPLLLPAGPSSPRGASSASTNTLGFACPSLTWGHPKIWGEGQQHPAPLCLAGVTPQVAGALEIPIQAACVSVCISFCCSTWIRRPSPPLPLAGLYAACARCRGEGTPRAPGLRASCPHPCWGQAVRAAALVLASPKVPQSPRPNPAALPGGMLGQAARRQGCRQHAGRDAGRQGACAGAPLPAQPVGRAASIPAASPRCILVPETKPG